MLSAFITEEPRHTELVASSAVLNGRFTTEELGGREALNPERQVMATRTRIKKGPNKRAKGEGTVYQRKSDGMWVASVELPSPDGRRRRKVVTAKTESQVKAKLKANRKELLVKGDLPTSGQTLATWMNVWFKEIALKKIRPRTAATYRTKIEKYIIPSIGKVRLDKLTPAHVRKMHDYITTKPKDEKDPSKGFLSPTNALQAHRILSVALKYAEREGRVTRNVVALTDAPRKARADLGVLTAGHGVKVIQSVASDRLGSRWAAALFTGARQGELLGLEIDRIVNLYDEDLKREIPCLDLSWQLQRISWEHGCGGTCGRKRGTDCPDRKITIPADWEYRPLTGGLYLSRPKSDAGWRIIPLVEPIKTIIERRIAIASTEPNPYGLVWTSDIKYMRGGGKGAPRRPLPLDGLPLDPARDNLAWHAVLERAGVPSVPLHAARHTTASLLLAAGVPEPIIMKILGHSSYVVTRGYQTIDQKQLESAMKAISAKLE